MDKCVYCKSFNDFGTTSCSYEDCIRYGMQEEEEESTVDLEPAWTDIYLGTMGLSMNDFL